MERRFLVKASANVQAPEQQFNVIHAVKSKPWIMANMKDDFVSPRLEILVMSCWRRCKRRSSDSVSRTDGNRLNWSCIWCEQVSLYKVFTQKKIAFHVGKDACISLSIFITNALASPAHTQPSAVSRSTFFQDDGGQCHWKTQSNTRLLKGPYCNCKSLRRHITAGNNVQMCDFFRGERYHLHAATHATCHLTHLQLCTMYHDVSLLRPCCSIHFFGSSMNQCCGKPSWKKLRKGLKLREVNRSAVLRRPLDKEISQCSYCSCHSTQEIHGFAL